MPEQSLPWRSIHHVAIIAGDYEASKRFYSRILGLRILAETYREERRSWKLDLETEGGDRIELFSFPDAPSRPDRPEARGLRHLAFAVPDVAAAAALLEGRGVPVEPLRLDPLTGKAYTFFADPDGLPLELYEN